MKLFSDSRVMVQDERKMQGRGGARSSTCWGSEARGKKGHSQQAAPFAPARSRKSKRETFACGFGLVDVCAGLAALVPACTPTQRTQSAQRSLSTCADGPTGVAETTVAHAREYVTMDVSANAHVRAA
eukprot:6211056-Pleurochrysis_carterae.AAC.1